MVVLCRGVTVTLNFKKENLLDFLNIEEKQQIKEKNLKTSALALPYCPYLEAQSSQSFQQECSRGENEMYPQRRHSGPQGQ